MTETPVLLTCEGSWGIANDTRFCTLTWSMLISVPSSKNTLTVLAPVLVVSEEM